MKRSHTVVFVGNPNVGKSAWINALCDAHLKVGNWAGVTVEKVETFTIWEKEAYHLIDLPGTYGLQSTHAEESIATTFLQKETIDCIVNVVDATNFERNLYLTMELCALRKPMIIIANYMDEVENYRISIAKEKLQHAFSIPILFVSAFRKEDKQLVKQTIIKQIQEKHCAKVPFVKQDQEALSLIQEKLYKQLPSYLSFTQEAIEDLAFDLYTRKPSVLRQCQSWDITKWLIESFPQSDPTSVYYRSVDHMMQFVRHQERRMHRTRKWDRLLLHPLWGGIICFLLFGGCLFFIFQGSAPWNDLIDFLIQDIVIKYVYAYTFFLGDMARSLLVHGVIAGVGGVLVFVPLMAYLHFVLSFLEESGYMARIACIMDPWMQKFSLNGKSFVSLLLGFGCNVPAIYATRTLDNEKQRRLTALLVPFLSCGARLPVYLLFGAAFFGKKAFIMIASIYGLGVCLALFCAFLFSKCKGFYDDSLFLLELPPYRRPKFSVLFSKVKEEVKAYLRKATGVVMWAMVALWAISYFPNGDMQTSYLTTAAKQTAFLFEPLGFGDRYECVAALPGSIIAKETVIGYFSQVLLKEEERIEPPVFSQDLQEIGNQVHLTLQKAFFPFVSDGETKRENDGLEDAIASLWSDSRASLKAYCYMVFILLTIPCIMTLQAIGKEYGWKLLCTSLILMMIIPYFTAGFFYQFFSLLMQG